MAIRAAAPESQSPKDRSCRSQKGETPAGAIPARKPPEPDPKKCAHKSIRVQDMRMRGRSPYRLFGSFHPVGMAAPLGIRSEAVPDNPGLSCTSKIIPLNGMPVRLKVSYSLDKGILPLDYRRGFASLLKEAIKRSDAHRYRRYYFRHHVLKPFTFSVFFPGLKGVESSSQKRLRVGSRNRTCVGWKPVSYV